MRKALEKYFLSRWYSSQPIKFLKPLAWYYAKVTKKKRQSFLKKQINSYQAPVPIIVVGNITLGGTGKTPVVIYLVETLRSQGLNPAVISRGYGASADTNQLVSAGMSSQMVGDEPILIHARSLAPVAIGRKRKDSIELLLKTHPDIDIIISDDGLQHYAMERDVELCIIDSVRGLGNEALIPAGPLRESKERLQEIDLILCNFNESEHHCVSEKALHFSLQGNECINVVTQEKKFLKDFINSKLHALAGIGNPQRFFTTLSKVGLNFSENSPGDHQAVSDEYFAKFDGEPVLMTEKDAVKYQHLNLNNLWYLPVSVNMSDEDQNHLINFILNKVNIS